MRAALLPVRIATLALAAALASIVAYWALQLLAPRPAIAPAAASETVGAIDPAPAARLFGGAAPAAPTASAPSNMQVAGVVASGRLAAVVLSIDGQPARAYGVGTALPDGARVVEVRADRVVLDRDGARIELPAPARPSVALLTSGPRAPQSIGPAGASPAPPVGAAASAPARAGASPVPAPAAGPVPAPAAGTLPTPGLPPGLSVPPAAGAAMTGAGAPPAASGAPGARPPAPGVGPRGTAP